MNDIMRGTFDPNSGLASQGDDSKVFAQFYTRSVVDGQASKEAGRQINKDMTYIKIIQPGESRLGTYDQPATETDTMRFPRQWQSYKTGQEQTAEGSPMSLLFPANPAIVDNLRNIGFHTVEQLANANDSALQNIGLGGREFQQKAKQYLAAADKGKDFHSLAAKVETLVNQAEADRQKIAALEAELARREEPVRRGPGRPPKHEQAA